jgi:hypothetical protein
MFKLYADDLTLYRKVNNSDDCALLQNDLNALYQWALEWQLKINFDKCRIMHFGYKPSQYIYKLNDFVIVNSECEKILGVYIDSKLNFSEHVFNIVTKSRQISNILLRAFNFCDNEVLINLFKTYVRPHLEYASVVFSPRHLYLTDLLENVQRHFTKRLAGLSNISYSDRLLKCNIESLETRRIHIDLTLLYKYLHGFVVMQLHDCIVPSPLLFLRGNSHKLTKHFAKLDVKRFSFANRVVNIWNSLDEHIVSSPTPNIFVNRLIKINYCNFFVRGRALLHI